MFPNLRLLLLRFFIVVQEINYPSCFIVYYEIKKRNSVPSRYFVDHTAYPVLSKRIRRVSVCVVSSFVDTSENNAKKLVSTTGESFSPWVGLYGICIVSQITQNQVRLVRNYGGEYWTKMLLDRTVRCIISNLPVYCLTVPGMLLCRTR